jgi:rhomboid family protein
VLLLPVGLEDRAIHRVPVVTLGLIVANALAFVVTWAAGSARSTNAEVLRDLLEKTLEERPYVAVSERLARELGKERQAAVLDARATAEARGALPPADQRRREQKDFDALVDDYFDAESRLPWHRFGFIPARPALWTLLTAMFMHAGWLHLLGNMLFLYVSGAYIEEAYGKAVYAAGYLLSGLFATVGYAYASPQSTVPLVGASGAIAGIMGMVLVRLSTSKIRFLFMPFLFLPHIRIRLSLPALVVLPLWGLEQLWYAARTPAGEGGVAWWAHVAGFLFGVAFAAAVMALRVEDRWLGRSAQMDEGRRALDNATEARASGHFERARDELRRARAGEPESTDTLLEAYELALAEQDTAELTRAMARLLDVLPRRGEAGVALDLVDDGRWAGVPEVPPRLYFSVAGFLERQGQTARALEIYDEIIRGAAGDVLALRAAVRRGELYARAGDTQAARRALEDARSHPAVDEQWRATIDRALGRLGRGA